MISPYRLAGEMPPAPRPAKVIRIDLEDDIESAVACRRLEDVEAEQPRDDGFLQHLCVYLMLGLGTLGIVALIQELATR